MAERYYYDADGIGSLVRPDIIQRPTYSPLKDSLDKAFYFEGVRRQIESLLRMRTQVNTGTGGFAGFSKSERAKQMTYILRKLRKLEGRGGRQNHF